MPRLAPTLHLAALALLFASACAKHDSAAGAPSTAAPSTAAPAQAPAAAAPPAQTDPTNARDRCKKLYATSCALPCERTAQATEKDPNRLKTELNRCMVSCLEKAEGACPR
jgi:hypothetical protein